MKKSVMLFVLFFIGDRPQKTAQFVVSNSNGIIFPGGVITNSNILLPGISFSTGMGKIRILDQLTRGQWPYRQAASETRRSDLASDLKSVTSITYISM